VGKSKTKPKSKTKTRGKTRSTSIKERSISSEIDNSFVDIDIPQTTPKPSLHHKKIWVVAILVVLAACLIWPVSQSWIVRSYFPQAVTYPKASVFGMNVGSLSTGQLTDKLVGLKSAFETKKITLINDKKQWAFDANKLGVTFDAGATSQAVWRLNNLDIVDKYKLITGGISSEIKPTIAVDSKTCIKALSVIPATQTKPKDATVYFDTSLKIQSDQPGTKFNATLTCQDVTKILASNSFVTNVSLDTTVANVTKADLQSKLPKIQSMVGKSLSLKTSSGTYQRTLTSKQLLSLLDISKKSSVMNVSWSSSKLDELVNGIAAKVDTYNNTPTLGNCQYVISSGGYWLDVAATKKIFTDLGADSSRSYILPIVYHAAAIGETKRVPISGSAGTIYLTFDDGMTYADQIMDYAACYGVKVTFFEIGERVVGDAPQLRRAIAEGHTVQSHGHYHAMYDYGDRTYSWQYNDMHQSIADIVSITGVRPTYFRPPGGNRSDNTYKAAAANGLKLILWGVSSQDATGGGISSAQTCANVLAGAYPGASVLMHSIHYSTAMAFPCIVEGLAARGYSMQALR
jgi:peptidoglycan/xylan/chitin deacetylase (PgdA/CDA1 family)